MAWISSEELLSDADARLRVRALVFFAGAAFLETARLLAGVLLAAAFFTSRLLATARRRRLRRHDVVLSVALNSTSISSMCRSTRCHRSGAGAAGDQPERQLVEGSVCTVMLRPMPSPMVDTGMY